MMRSAPRHSAPACVAVIASALLALFFLTPTAEAHHKAGHPNGPPEGADPAGHASENTDADGTANVADPSGDADNQHPSGKDKHADNGVTGHSTSDPDGDSNGGADKPGGAGGVDQLDQDGNNGCGNDDDFEDDNNGNCGGKNKTSGVSRVSSTGDGSTVRSSLAAADHEIFSASRADATDTVRGTVTGARRDGELAAVDHTSVLGISVSFARPGRETTRGASVGTTEDDDDQTLGFIGEMARTGLALGVLAAAGLAFIAAAKALLDRTNRLASPA